MSVPLVCQLLEVFLSGLILGEPSMMHLNASSINTPTNGLTLCSRWSRHVSHKRSFILWWCEEQADSTIYSTCCQLSLEFSITNQSTIIFKYIWIIVNQHLDETMLNILLVCGSPIKINYLVCCYLWKLYIFIMNNLLI